MAHPQAVGRPSDTGHQRRHRVLFTGEHDRRGTVDRRDRHPAGHRVQLPLHLGQRRADGDHRAAVGQGRHQPATGGDQSYRVGTGEHTGDVGGGQLADRVTDQTVRAHSPLGEERVQGDLEGEQRGLRVVGTVQQAVVGGVDHLQQGAVEPRCELLAQRGERRVEHGEGRAQFTAHSGPLGALARAEQRHLGTRARGAAQHRRTVHTVGQVAQPGEQALGVAGQHGRPAGQRCPGRRQRVPGVQRGGSAAHVGQRGRQPPGVGAQPGLVAAADQPGGDGQAP